MSRRLLTTGLSAAVAMALVAGGPAPAGAAPAPAARPAPAGAAPAPAARPAPAAQQLKLTAVPGVTFPQRAYVLSSSTGLSVSPNQIAVTENGQPVSGLSVQSANTVGESRFATVLLISSGQSMQGARIQAALQAARTFLAARNTAQPVSIVFFNDTTTVGSPLTTNSAALERTLIAPPQLAGGRHVFDAAAEAVQMLAAAHVQHGSIILLADGQDTGSRATQQTVAAGALAQGVTFYGIGVLAPSQGDNLHSLAAATQGVYSTVASSGLVTLYQHLAAALASQFSIRYTAVARLGSAVDVAVAVPGAGTATSRYTAQLPSAGPVTDTTHRSVVTTTSFALATALLGALLIGLTVFLLTRQRSGVASRISGYVQPNVPGSRDSRREVIARALGESRAEAIGSSPRWRSFLEEMEIAGIDMSPLQVVGATVVVTIAAGALLVASTGSPIAGALAALMPFLVLLVIRAAADRQRRMFDEQLPDNLQVVASAMRAGSTFVGALSVVVEDAPEPSRRELRRALTDEQLGIPLDEALDAVTKRMKSDDFHHVSIIAALQRDTGGNTAEVVDLVTDTVRERIELKGMVRALTAQGRLAGLVLTALPPGILVIVSIINPTYVHPLFHRTAGLIALGVCAAMAFAGSYAINRIVNIDV